MIEIITQILGIMWVVLCLSGLAWAITRYIHIKLKKPRT